jgi:hypothetical protein
LLGVLGVSLGLHIPQSIGREVMRPLNRLSSQ